MVSRVLGLLLNVIMLVIMRFGFDIRVVLLIMMLCVFVILEKVFLVSLRIL